MVSVRSIAEALGVPIASTSMVASPAINAAAPPTPLPVFTGRQMAEALAAYRDLQTALDQAMPDQIMQLDGKAFRKKGYWRAVKVAFNLTVELVDERREVDGLFEDGKENFGYIVTYRASTPTRSVAGDGACFCVEKASKNAAAAGKRWTHRSAQASVHNVRSHAHTRAFNRAVSNLVGFGEVSAEEVSRDTAPEPKIMSESSPFEEWPDASNEPELIDPEAVRPRPVKPSVTPKAGVISVAQAHRFYAIAKAAGWEDAALHQWLLRNFGLTSDREIPWRRYKEICGLVQGGPVADGPQPEQSPF